MARRRRSCQSSFFSAEGLETLARLGVRHLGGVGPPVERRGRQLAIGLERQRSRHVGVGVLVHRELELPERLLVLDQEDVDQSLKLGIDIVVGNHAIEQSPFDAALRGVQRADEVDLLGPPAADEADHARRPAPARCHGAIDLGHSPAAALADHGQIAGHGDL